MLVDEFDYELPQELIAQTPLERREDSRLMVVDPVQQTITHSRFDHLLDFLKPGDLLVFNNSKVIPARLYGVKEDTGAKIEMLLARSRSEFEWVVMAKPAKRLKPGTRILFTKPGEDEITEGVVTPPSAVVTEILDEGLRVVRFELEGSLEAFWQDYGTMPLPPYIQTPLKNSDRYQTVYAEPVGSVAAPTAGLHFTNELLERIRQFGVETRFVTLHVGLGTFRPVQVEEVERHTMHTETYEVTEETADAVNRAKREGRRVIAVGTTALRTLESAVDNGVVKPGRRDTGIFIYPGYKFQVIEALITNFHLPKSTLLMLVSALMGTQFTKAAYEEAVKQRYRFFSFGDAMFITRRADRDESASSV